MFNKQQKYLIFFLSIIGYRAVAKQEQKTILDIQPNRSDLILDVRSKDNNKHGFVRLINLNPKINIWFILEVTYPGDEKHYLFHLENVDPSSNIVLDKAYPFGLRVVNKQGVYQCELWRQKEASELLQATKSAKTYAPICEDRILVRNRTQGQETTKEWVADFLRSHVWGGEKITSLVKEYLFKDKFLLVAQAEKKGPATEEDHQEPSKPLRARLAVDNQSLVLEAKNLGINLTEKTDNSLMAGRWYETKAQSGVYISTIQASIVAKDIMESYTDRVQKLDSVEQNALVYLIAFDLNQYRIGYALGTKHPSAEWSDRAPEKARDPSLPGPDGIANFEPLTLTGKVSPVFSHRVIGTFTAGFKRTHGAFKWGKLSQVNHASHYGFMENGIIFSRLNPELATLIITKDYKLMMKTWSEDDSIENVLHARQNGVPIIEWDEEKKQGIPHRFTGNWSNGNWSGSQDSKQRALRAAICLQETKERRFLIYGYFSSATPNAMARVFQAYECSYAMHLDMNALEHTYLAIYKKKHSQFTIEHLIEGMEVLDRESKGQEVPRFVGTADNRDFFYVMDYRSQSN